MKKSIIILILLCSITICYSQNRDLQFDVKFYNTIDSYVVFPKKEKDTTYAYGFVYMDSSAGITFRYYGTMKLNNGVFISSEKNPEYKMMIYRLDSNTSNVYVFNENDIKSLQLPTTPAWLATYKSDEDTAEYMKDVGNKLNRVGGSQAALNYLEKAYSIEPHLNGLEFELAFAYNALQQFEKAIPVLKKAIQNDSNNFLFYKELGYAYKYLGKIDEAEKTYKEGIKLTTNNTIRAEMSLNMAHSYFELKNRVKFNEWAKITRESSKPDSQFSKYLDMFENDWDKK